MVAGASKQNQALNFNRLFPGSARVVVNNREILGAFTKGGWTFMQDAVKHADRFFGGERWVLGKQATAGIDPATLEKQLSERYKSDFVTQWRNYLRATAVVRYRHLGAPAQIPNIVSGNHSPLPAAMWRAPQNAAVEFDSTQQDCQHAHRVALPAA